MSLTKLNKRGSSGSINEDEDPQQMRIAARADGKMGVTDLKRLKKRMEEQVPSDEGSSEIEEIDLEAVEIAKAVAAQSNPIERSQQFKAVVKEQLRSSKRVSKEDSDQDYNEGEDPEDEEEDVSIACDDEYDDDDEEDVDEEEEEQETIEELEEKIPILTGKKPKFDKKPKTTNSVVKNLKLAKKEAATLRNKISSKERLNAAQKKIGMLQKLKLAPSSFAITNPGSYSKHPTYKRAGSLENVTLGVEKRELALGQSKKGRDDHGDSNHESTTSQTRKRRRQSEEVLSTAIHCDLAPDDTKGPFRDIRGVSIHIGKGIYVKTYPYGDTNILAIRSFENGKANPRRGINLQIASLPDLNKAIDTAYENYA